MAGKRERKSFGERWAEAFLRYEFLTSVLVTVLFFLWFEYLSGRELVNQVLYGNRSSIYGALAAIFGALLGFVITAVSIVIGYSASERLEVVRKSKHYADLWKIFISAIRATALATMAALLGLVFDRDSSPSTWILFLNIFAFVLVLFRLGRSIWVLEQIINLLTQNVKAKSENA
jgi:hypothetical protein